MLIETGLSTLKVSSSTPTASHPLQSTTNLLAIRSYEHLPHPRPTNDEAQPPPGTRLARDGFSCHACVGSGVRSAGKPIPNILPSNELSHWFAIFCCLRWRDQRAGCLPEQPDVHLNVGRASASTVRIPEWQMHIKWRKWCLADASIGPSAVDPFDSPAKREVNVKLRSRVRLKA